MAVAQKMNPRTGAVSMISGRWAFGVVAAAAATNGTDVNFATALSDDSGALDVSGSVLGQLWMVNNDASATLEVRFGGIASGIALAPGGSLTLLAFDTNIQVEVYHATLTPDLAILATW
jgi:hypothetical protein|tara:strand:- start:3326 stop:3682 length:357 start_codon:yes stop_codon:yes gene_type:complete